MSFIISRYIEVGEGRDINRSVRRDPHARSLPPIRDAACSLPPDPWERGAAGAL